MIPAQSISAQAGKLTRCTPLTAYVPPSAVRRIPGRDYGRLVPVVYASAIARKQKAANVLLPPGYSEHERYPVLYLNHGMFGDQWSMLDEGLRICTMAGNLAAQGRAERMVIVFTSMYTSADSEQCKGYTPEEAARYDAFREDLTACLMPYIGQQFSVKTGRAFTGISGFSMGGREALYIGLTKPESFGYIGAVCPAPGVTPGRDHLMSHAGCLQESELKVSDAACQPELLFLAGGSCDGVVRNVPQHYHRLLTANGQPHLWFEIPGGDHDGSSVVPAFFQFLQHVFRSTGNP